jgi:acyl-CoA synthetase (AMP-forming)/AMP-acid ligase II
MRPPNRLGRIVVLTSGTTGVPRGVYRKMPRDIGPFTSMLSRIPLRAGDRILIAAPLFHTWGLGALQMAFGLRGTAVLQRHFEPASTLDRIIRHDCTALVAVPAMLQRLLDIPDRPTRLRVVAVSGSALTGALASRFMDRYGDILYNLYGSTEVSWSSIANPHELRSAPGTVGLPPRGTAVSIMDDDGHSLPHGMIGRIFVANEMLFDGYTDGAEPDEYDGLINTGDLGRIGYDGLLYVDGRQDDMIISGGENVYPGPVEDCIAQLPHVREVAVVGVQDAELGQRLAAYIVCQAGHRLDGMAVREHVRSALGRFAVPRDVVFLAGLPRNATGKVVTRDLPPSPPARKHFD